MTSADEAAVELAASLLFRERGNPIDESDYAAAVAVGLRLGRLEELSPRDVEDAVPSVSRTAACGS